MDTSFIQTSTEPQSGSTVPKNRILANFRATVGGDPDVVNFFAAMERRLILKGERSFFSEAEQLHAERVLGRLVSFTA